MEAPKGVEELPYKGLWNLVGHGLVVGSNTPRDSIESGEFKGEEHSSMEKMRWLTLQVFEVPEGIKVRNGIHLPLVARIDSGPDPGISVEYCRVAPKYFDCTPVSI